jgi:hypothetical protein
LITSLTLSNGASAGVAKAQFSIASLAVGNHTITVNYLGDLVYDSSTGSLTGNPQVVNLGYGTNYLAFAGEGVVLDSPTTSACQSNNINFNRPIFQHHRL